MEFSSLEPFILKRKALQSTLALWSFDSDTRAPKKAIENSAKIMGVLSEEYFNLINNKEVIELLDQVETTTDVQKALVKEWKTELNMLCKIPKDEYVEYQSYVVMSQRIWNEAKNKNDYEMFKPYLKKIVETQKKFASYRKVGEESLYDILLNDYEEGFNTEILDEFFNKLKEVIVPMIHKIKNSNVKIDTSFDHLSYDIETQKQVNNELAKYIGFDFDCGIISETEHPYTTHFHNKDVRFTNHFYENYLSSALFSTVHEGGHAIYEMGVSDELTLTPLGEGKSMGMHESQSRFYENMIGRSKGLWNNFYPTLQNAFKEQLGNVSVDDFYLGINHSKPSLIRIESDELTYSLHILIRYELEKQMINGTVDYDKLPEMWDNLYEKYLGVKASNLAEGILQDVHWSGGMLGYFPSYALGSAIAAQIFAHYQKTIDIEHLVEQGQFDVIKQQLKNDIHQYGKMYSTNTLLKNMMGEEFNPNYYITYLVDKYSKIYQL